MTAVHVALLGLSHPHSLAHLRTLQAVEEVESISLWDGDPALLQSVAESQGEKVRTTTTDLNAILSQEQISIAVAALRNDLGPSIFLQTLAAGKHLITDKPIGKTALEARMVTDAARQHGLQLGVFYQNRALPAAQDGRRLIAQGLLGDLISVELRMITTQIKFRNPQHWLFNQGQAGGGILSWLGCHYIDLIEYITQDPIVSVAAQTATRSGEAIDVEDVAVLALGLQSGALGVMHAGYMLALSGEGYHNRTGYDNYLSVNGRLGRLLWTSAGPPTSLYVESVHPDWASAPQRTFDYVYGQSPAYGGPHGESFLRSFIRACQGDGPALATGEDAVHVAQVVDAAYASQRTGQRIILEAGVPA